MSANKIKSPKHEKVLVSPGLIRRWVTSATEALPTELSPRLARWWEEGGLNNVVVPAAIKDAIDHPPILGKMMETWRRFYWVMFGIRLPATISARNDCNDWRDFLASDWVLCEGSLDGLKDRLLYLPLDMGGRSIEEDLCTLDSIYTIRPRSKLSSPIRNFPWYLLRIASSNEPAPLRSGATVEEGDVGELTFQELLIQQLFNYWISRPFPDKRLPALGSRMGGMGSSLVPTFTWINGQLFLDFDDRSKVVANQFINGVRALKEE